MTAELVFIDTNVLVYARDSQDQFRLSWWDAVVLASAQLAGCQTLLSEDFQHGQQFGEVRVSSPFRTAPSKDTR